MAPNSFFRNVLSKLNDCKAIFKVLQLEIVKSIQNGMELKRNFCVYEIVG
jgi:hypothetical protein